METPNRVWRLFPVVPPQVFVLGRAESLCKLVDKCRSLLAALHCPPALPAPLAQDSSRSTPNVGAETAQPAESEIQQFPET